MSYRIPFNKPFIVGRELEYVRQSVESGHTAGDGMFTKKCHALLKQALNSKKIMLTTSGTAALEMAALLCDIGPGDEVILPSFTFVSTANVFHLRGARVVFADIRPDTLNIDAECIRESISENTRVIVPVHYAGVGCDMDAIAALAGGRGIRVVEDAAQALGSTHNGRSLGTIGDIGAFSFHETKNFICGEGGAISINDESLIRRAEIIRDKGTNRSSFIRGEVDKYTWVDIGSSFSMSDILAAFLYAQLEYMDAINKRRAEIFDLYMHLLTPLKEQGLLDLPGVPDDCTCNNHMFYILLSDMKTRDDLMTYLRDKGILAVFHYVPLHSSPLGLSMGYQEGQFPITESVSSRILRLPFYFELEVEDQIEVIGHIETFLGVNQS